MLHAESQRCSFSSSWNRLNQQTQIYHRKMEKTFVYLTFITRENQSETARTSRKDYHCIMCRSCALRLCFSSCKLSRISSADDVLELSTAENCIVGILVLMKNARKIEKYEFFITQWKENVDLSIFQRFRTAFNETLM